MTQAIGDLPLDARLDHIKISLIQPCVAQLQVTQLIAFIWVDSGIIDDEVRSLRCQEAWQRVANMARYARSAVPFGTSISRSDSALRNGKFVPQCIEGEDRIIALEDGRGAVTLMDVEIHDGNLLRAAVSR